MKHSLKVIGIGLVLGLVLLLIKQALHIPGDTFWGYYWIFGVAVIAAAVISISAVTRRR